MVESDGWMSPFTTTEQIYVIRIFPILISILTVVILILVIISQFALIRIMLHVEFQVNHVLFS